MTVTMHRPPTDSDPDHAANDLTLIIRHVRANATTLGTPASIIDAVEASLGYELFGVRRDLAGVAAQAILVGVRMGREATS